MINFHQTITPRSPNEAAGYAKRALDGRAGGWRRLARPHAMTTWTRRRDGLTDPSLLRAATGGLDYRSGNSPRLRNMPATSQMVSVSHTLPSVNTRRLTPRATTLRPLPGMFRICLLYTSDAADE